MNFISHRPQAPYLVSHTLHIKPRDVGMDIQSVQANLTGLPGVLAVDCAPEEGCVKVTYDLRQVHLQDIETAFQTMGIALKHGFFSHLSHTVTHIIEELEDNNQFANSHRPDQTYNPFVFVHRNLQEENKEWISIDRPAQQMTAGPSTGIVQKSIGS